MSPPRPGQSTNPEIITLGCRLNTFESEVIRANARAANLGDVVIVNTCAVTAEAERQARQTIRRLRRGNPRTRIIVTGCAAQVNPDFFAGMPEVDQVIGNEEKLEPSAYTVTTPVQVTDIMEVRETAGHMIAGFEDRTRAFVQVQQGCDHRCTFCIIPFARGPNRSVPAARIVNQIRTLTENGYSEVVMTGVDVSSYGNDYPDGQARDGLNLGALARQVLDQVPDLKRLRLSSLDPAYMDDGIFRLLADEPRFMPHLHLSLQAGDDTVLKRMKRRHSRAEALDVCRRARAMRPDVVFGADLIAGFPTETDDMFENTLAAVGEMGLIYLHVFPYSPRPNTPAERMPPVPAPVIKDRASRLRAAGETALNRFLKGRVGDLTEVLVEKNNVGRCPHFSQVDLSFDAQPGSIVPVRISGAGGGRLTGNRAVP